MVKHFKNYFNRDEQLKLLEIVRGIAKEAPLFVPTMPYSDKELNIKITSCGEWGWISDRKGYRYSKKHPHGTPWPNMPPELKQLAIDIASEVGEENYNPDSCLINLYKRSGGRLGLHQDITENNKEACIVSISLGDSCIFAVGGTRRSDPIQRGQVNSGDVIVLYGDSRMAFHGVDKVIPNSDLLKHGGRVNLTIRQVI